VHTARTDHRIRAVGTVVPGDIGTGSDESGMRLWELAPDPVDLLVIEGAGHYEMHDEPEYVDTAVARLADFYWDDL
jgi:pimeloyl-ACP methyl ester carboxylesterase